MGAHYEVKNGSEITKYYMAGSTRIAMRKYTIPQNMTVEYMLSDHLGSTSLTTDTSGAKVLELRYKAWGEVRATWTSSPSTTPAYKMPLYTYTGQASYMDDPTTGGVTEGFGLMFYQSRCYDPQLSRFTQADTITPESTQGTQAWDRYAGMNNNPVRYNDPTGHVVTEGCGDDGKSKCAADPSTTEAEEDLGKIAMLEQEAHDRKCAAGDRSYCSGWYRTPDELVSIGSDLGFISAGMVFTPLAPLAPAVFTLAAVIYTVGRFQQVSNVPSARWSTPSPTPPATSTQTSAPTATANPTATGTTTPTSTATPWPTATATPLITFLEVIIVSDTPIP